MVKRTTKKDKLIKPDFIKPGRLTAIELPLGTVRGSIDRKGNQPRIYVALAILKAMGLALEDRAVITRVPWDDKIGRTRIRVARALNQRMGKGKSVVEATSDDPESARMRIPTKVFDNDLLPHRMCNFAATLEVNNDLIAVVQPSFARKAPGPYMERDKVAKPAKARPLKPRAQPPRPDTEELDMDGLRSSGLTEREINDILQRRLAELQPWKRKRD